MFQQIGPDPFDLAASPRNWPLWPFFAVVGALLLAWILSKFPRK